MKVPSHKILIDRYLNWNLVQERLSRYKSINKYFPLETLKACSSKPPYYCHYLSWRLGTWQEESLFEFLDSLLEITTSLDNWNKTKVPEGCKFEEFWSFLWELQVAKMFLDYNVSVEWTNSGPDLKVISGSEKLFVECTIYHKSFALEEFINELLSHINENIKVSHKPFIKYSLPNNAIEPFLDELFMPLLNDDFLQEIIKKSEVLSPIQLSKPNYVDNFFIFIENENPDNIDRNRPWTMTGSPDDYLSELIAEVVKKKKGSNKLKSHKPNLLAVNLLLDRDFQLANALRDIPLPDIKDFEALFLAKCGIDEIPSLDKRVTFFHNHHPIKKLLNQ